MTTIDLSGIEAAAQRDAVNRVVDGLQVGEEATLTSPDPLTALRSQIEATRAGELSWEDLPSAPGRSSARVSRLIPLADARPILAEDGEPFGMIMATAANVEPGGAFVVMAPFEPVPLEGVLGAQGFDYEVAELEDGTWRVLFRRIG